jgi:hypothetical protein
VAVSPIFTLCSAIFYSIPHDKVDNERIWDALKPKFTFAASVLHACDSKLINLMNLLMKFKPNTDALPNP